MLNARKVGNIVYHQEFGKGEILMCSKDRESCLVYFGFAIWVRKGELKRDIHRLRKALRPFQFSCVING